MIKFTNYRQEYPEVVLLLNEDVLKYSKDGRTVSLFGEMTLACYKESEEEPEILVAIPNKSKEESYICDLPEKVKCKKCFGSLRFLSKESYYSFKRRGSKKIKILRENMYDPNHLKGFMNSVTYYVAE